MRRILSVGHSYVVAGNRRLAHEMAREGAGRWEVTTVAPERFAGDLRAMAVEALEGEAAQLRTVRVTWQRVPHLMSYADAARVMDGSWDVVHGWEEPYVRAGAQIARCAPPGAAFVPATFQNIGKRYPWPLSAFERTTMTRADGWIAFGETARSTLSSRPLYAARPVRVIPPGVDVARFAPDRDRGSRIRRDLGWPDADLVVGFLGRFVVEKGVRVLRDALERVSAPWRALFVGGGPLEAELRAFEKRHPSGVKVVTGVAHHDVPAWLNAMTILCAPSQTTVRWREQFGRMLIEAMASGLPVIASDSGEMPFVVDGAGVIVSEGDVSGWASAIERLLGDGGERRERAARGLETARSRFAWPIVARQHLEFFEELLAQRSARS